jgi:uncharacterized membrane protein YfcA
LRAGSRFGYVTRVTLSLWIAAPLLVLAGTAAGFLNVVAGGGSLLTVPLMIFLGVPEATANGTSRVGILVQSASALVAFRRSGKLQPALVGKLAAPTILGALLGAYLGSQLSDAGFRSVLGWVMLGCGLLVVIEPPAVRARSERLGPLYVWPTLFVVGVYGGMIQAGVGYLILAALTFVLGLELELANVLKSLLIALYMPLAAAVFLWHGHVDLWLAVALSLGHALGGWLGAVVALRSGATLIKVMLAVVVVGSGVALLLL